MIEFQTRVQVDDEEPVFFVSPLRCTVDISGSPTPAVIVVTVSTVCNFEPMYMNVLGIASDDDGEFGRTDDVTCDTLTVGAVPCKSTLETSAPIICGNACDDWYLLGRHFVRANAWVTQDQAGRRIDVSLVAFDGGACGPVDGPNITLNLIRDVTSQCYTTASHD